jgi:hypothetical protein
MRAFRREQLPYDRKTQAFASPGDAKPIIGDPKFQRIVVLGHRDLDVARFAAVMLDRIAKEVSKDALQGNTPRANGE